MRLPTVSQPASSRPLFSFLITLSARQRGLPAYQRPALTVLAGPEIPVGGAGAHGGTYRTVMIFDIFYYCHYSIF